jgi:oligopeptide transport system permease protein
MGLAKQLLSTTLTWLFVVVVLICIILIPRDVEYRSGSLGNVTQDYDFSWSEYKESITSYATGVWENKSLGQSRFKISVEEEIGRYLPRSMKLIFLAFIICIPFGILKGIYDLKRTHTRRNLLGNGTTWLFQSLPDFFVVMVVQFLLLSLLFKTGIHISVYGHDQWYSFIVPSIILSIYPLFYIARITSSALAGEETQQYIQTARAKGLSSTIVLYKHMLSNCWGVILSHISSIMIFVISNLLIIEYLMFYKGAAYRLFEAMGHHETHTGNFFRSGMQVVYEIEVVIGLLITFMLFILIAQFISQVAKFYMDPRWRDES